MNRAVKAHCQLRTHPSGGRIEIRRLTLRLDRQSVPVSATSRAAVARDDLTREARRHLGHLKDPIGNQFASTRIGFSANILPLLPYPGQLTRLLTSCGTAMWLANSLAAAGMGASPSSRQVGAAPRSSPAGSSP